MSDWIIQAVGGWNALESNSFGMDQENSGDITREAGSVIVPLIRVNNPDKGWQQSSDWVSGDVWPSQRPPDPFWHSDPFVVAGLRV